MVIFHSTVTLKKQKTKKKTRVTKMNQHRYLSLWHIFVSFVKQQPNYKYFYLDNS